MQSSRTTTSWNGTENSPSSTMEESMKYITVVCALLVVGGSLPLDAQQVTLGGQIRPRFEFREPAANGDDGFTSMRARINLSALLERNVRVFLQLQDVRLWGEETGTLSDFRADNFDLHQGYIEVGHSGDTGFDLRVGRQEIALGGERLVGPVGWTQQGQAFDGVRALYEWPKGSVNVLGFKTGEAIAAP